MPFKDLNSTVAKMGSVFIGLMTPDCAIWFRYQREMPVKLKIAVSWASLIFQKKIQMLLTLKEGIHNVH